MKQSRVSRWLGLLALTPAALAAVAVSGRVVDETGAPIAGARVRAINGQLKSDVANSSDATGLFRLEVPIEGNYELRAEHEGFFVFTAASMYLAGGTPLEIRMNRQSELAESVSVRYSAPAVDPEQSEETKRIDRQGILNIPTVNSQDFRSALPLMPGVVRDNSGRAHFNGARAAQTNYRMNGFNISDPVSGDLTARLNVDSVETLEWEATRFAADSGKGSAGVMQVRTQMGDDRFRFGGTNFVPGLGTQGGAHLNHWSPRLMFSGPLRRNRAWFHNAFDLYYVADTVPELASGRNRSRSISGSNLTRLQWNVRENQILTGSFLVNLTDSRRVGLSILNPAEATVDRRQSMLLGTFKYQFLTRKGLVEFGYAGTGSYFHDAPQGTLPYLITPFGSSGNFFRDDRQHSERQEWLLNGYTTRRWHGTHQLGAGTDIERNRLDETVLRRELRVVRADGTPVRDVRFSGSPHLAVTNVEIYGYLTDHWNVLPSLSLDLGLRTQWDRYARGTSPAPRLAAAWAPRWLHGTKLSAGWGLFRDPLTLRTLSLHQEQSSVSTYYSPSGTQPGLPIVTRYVVDPRDLQVARFALTSLSAERRIAGSIDGRVTLTSREGSRAPTLFNRFTPPGNDYYLSNSERQRYHAAEFSARGAFLSRYQWSASYTRSSARSSAVLNYSVETPLMSPQRGGPLDWDSPHRFLAWGWMPVTREWFPAPLSRIVGETDFQMLLDYRTGFPFTITTENGRVVGEPNQARFPDYLSVNIALERKFPFRGYLWAFRAGLINVLDRQNSNVVNSDFDSPQFMRFSRGQPRAVNVRLRFLGRK